MTELDSGRLASAMFVGSEIVASGMLPLPRSVPRELFESPLHIGREPAAIGPGDIGRDIAAGAHAWNYSADGIVTERVAEGEFGQTHRLVIEQQFEPLYAIEDLLFPVAAKE